MGFGSSRAKVMVVSRMHNSEAHQQMIEAELVGAGLALSDVYFTAALKCRTWEQEPGPKEIKACREFLDAEIAEIRPTWILALGNEALSATTGHSGIMKYRGKVIDKGGYKVVATVATGSVLRNPGQAGSWKADMQFFVSQVLGRSHGLENPKVAFIRDKDQLKILKRLLLKADTLSYDIETYSVNKGSSEFDQNARIVSIAGTMTVEGRLRVWALPLYHPESPFKKTWKSVLAYLAPALCQPKKLIAHNGKFDARWLRHFGVPIRLTFDTMLAAHLLDENRIKGLKPLARIFLGVPDWGMDTGNLLAEPMMDVLKYNALDTFHTYHLYLILREQLIEQPRLLRIFTKLTMPASTEFIDIERRGVWIDQEKLSTATKVTFDMRDDIERRLMEFVPDPESPGSSLHAANDSPWPTNARGKPIEVNFNASNFARWWLFEHLGFPVYEWGKEKANGNRDPSMAEATMLELQKLKHPVIDLLLERVKWQKYCTSFVVPYQELVDSNSRIHTTFKLAGTVTGRLSSGKADEEKITASRGKLRGVNLQQVPRDAFIRGLFGAPPGYAFVEADFGQIEFRLAAFISRDRTAIDLLNRGEDVHLVMAGKMTGKPLSQVTKDERKSAKPVNFGFLYGMGWMKFIETSFLQYGISFTEAEARAARRAFFDLYPGFIDWHNRQRRIVAQYGRVQSPMGRIRHLPDIFSGNKQVRAEAERQAINSPVQAFASDMNLLSMIILCQRFRDEGIDAHVLGTVHDAINFEIAIPHLGRALPIIKDTMENLPLERKFGVSLDVPIISDLKVGTHWGGAHELTDDMIYSWNDSSFDKLIAA